MKKRILTGIQSSGVPHLGNLFGAIFPALSFQNDPNSECFYFIADLHSLTTYHKSKKIDKLTIETAAAWLACGFNYKKHYLYCQSHIPQIPYLAWILGCFTPYPMLANAHAFKEKSQNLNEVSAGLFTYPVLMSADILIMKANIIPVGKDQKQHIEITRDIAQKINHIFPDTFPLPEPYIITQVMTIPGIDGRKMSKSYNNTISIFEDPAEIKKKVFKIVTDSTPVESPKDPNKCIVFTLYSLVASPSQVQEMRENYLKGGYGYAQAKETLYKVLVEKFSDIRDKYNYFCSSPDLVMDILQEGLKKALPIAQETLDDLLSKLKISYSAISKKVFK